MGKVCHRALCASFGYMGEQHLECVDVNKSALYKRPVWNMSTLIKTARYKRPVNWEVMWACCGQQGYSVSTLQETVGNNNIFEVCVVEDLHDQ